jgi:hypothetical protein
MFKTKHTILILVITILVTLPYWGSRAIAAPTSQQSGCLLFSETIEGAGHYSVCDDANANFRTAFERWGLQKIGYPISRRYMRDGFVTQAFQKAIMQWRAETNSVALVNIFDDLHNMAFDDVLLNTRQTPTQLAAGWDGNLSFEEVVSKRQALLEERPALRTTYFASSNPLLFFGLPTSFVTDMGNHYAIRLQRAVLQEWKEDVPWARKGQVTIANGGDIAKELGTLPSEGLIAEGGNTVPPDLEPQPTNTPPLAPVAAVRSGGEWDFEGGYLPWLNLYGEDCPGGALAAGWNAFLSKGQFGSSCFNENKFRANIQSGNRSQEITFESIDATAGLWRPFSTTQGRRYRVSAWGIWHESPSPVMLELGIDGTGGQRWDAASVQWNPWGSPSAGTWQQSSIDFVATSTQSTLFLKGSHPIGSTSDPHPLRGGATLFDNVSIIELGAE